MPKKKTEDPAVMEEMAGAEDEGTQARRAAEEEFGAMVEAAERTAAFAQHAAFLSREWRVPYRP